jgi:CelD/BcsL family acetyltransferase involved in cellulose biosynthesis
MRDEWDGIVRMLPSPRFFHFPIWYESYLESLEDRPDDVVFAVVRDGPAAVAVLPLKQERRTVGGVSIRTLELPRHDHLHLRDILVAPSHAAGISLTMLVTLLKQCSHLRWDVLALWHALEDSCAMDAHRAGAPAMTLCTPRFNCSAIPLLPHEQMIAGLSKNFRKNLRRRGNLAEKMGEISFEAACEGAALAAGFSALLDVEASGWKGESGENSAIRRDERLLRFYDLIVRRFGKQGRCAIHLMKHRGNPIAATMELFINDVVYGMKCGYDEAYSELSPVHLLTEFLVKECDRHGGIRELNIVSDSPGFDCWRPRHVPVYNIYAFNTTIMGLAARAAMGVAQRMRGRREAAVDAARADVYPR